MKSGIFNAKIHKKIKIFQQHSQQESIRLIFQDEEKESLTEIEIILSYVVQDGNIQSNNSKIYDFILSLHKELFHSIVTINSIIHRCALISMTKKYYVCERW